MSNGTMVRLNQKPSRGSEADNISNLPDSLLLHILSFLSTRDAIRASLLSLRWQNLWTLVPCLDLDIEQFREKKDFSSFIDKFLNFRGKSLLQKFKVKYKPSECLSSRFKLWIDAAIMCKVELLEVEHDSDNLCDDRVEMSQTLFICNTLVVLKLDDVAFLDVPKKVSLSNLKIMHLDNVLFENDIAFKSLISGSPVLEELNISRHCEDNIKLLCISSHTLKQLIIEFDSFVDGIEEYGVVIDAPNLENLKLDDLDTTSFTITRIGSSSLKAHLDVRFGRHYRDKLEAGDFSMRSTICRLLTGISNARSLIILFHTFELLCQYRRFEELPQFHNLIHLEASLSRPSCKMLPAIVECCPNLKFLILRIYNFPNYNPLGLSLAASQHVFSSLETITLETPIFGDVLEMDMIKYLLKNSAVLKEMKVYLSKHLNREEESLIFKKLLMFPRLSTACQVHVEQHLSG